MERLFSPCDRLRVEEEDRDEPLCELNLDIASPKNFLSAERGVYVRGLVIFGKQTNSAWLTPQPAAVFREEGRC
jgi:hypothetical protein